MADLFIEIEWTNPVLSKINKYRIMDIWNEISSKISIALWICHWLTSEIGIESGVGLQVYFRQSKVGHLNIQIATKIIMFGATKILCCP